MVASLLLVLNCQGKGGPPVHKGSSGGGVLERQVRDLAVETQEDGVNKELTYWLASSEPHPVFVNCLHFPI